MAHELNCTVCHVCGYEEEKGEAHLVRVKLALHGASDAARKGAIGFDAAVKRDEIWVDVCPSCRFMVVGDMARLFERYKRIASRSYQASQNDKAANEERAAADEEYSAYVLGGRPFEEP